MKKVISVLFIILSIILCCVSIGEISIFDCIKGSVPIQQVFAIEAKDFNTIANRSIDLQTHKILLFYISISLLVLNSFICLNKESKAKAIVNMSLILIIVVYVLISHNYVFYLMLINAYLLYYFITHYRKRDILNIVMSIVSAVLCCVCIIMLYNRFRLPTLFDVPNIFEPMAQSSKHILTTFGLWIIPYIAMIFRKLCKPK